MLGTSIKPIRNIMSFLCAFLLADSINIRAADQTNPLQPSQNDFEYQIEYKLGGLERWRPVFDS
jgi:hypothetical protein